MLSFSTFEYLPDIKPITTIKSDESTLKNTKLNTAIEISVVLVFY